MNDEALDVCDVCQQGEDFQVVDEAPCSVLVSFDFKGKDGSGSVREEFLVERVVGVRRQRGVVDASHLRMLRQEVHDAEGVLHVAFHTE